MRCILVAVFGLFTLTAEAQLTIYTDRATERIRPVAEQYTAETGLAVQIVEMDYKALTQRLQDEGVLSPVDVIFVKDLVYLTELAAAGRFQAMDSKAIAESVETHLRDPQNLWTGVTLRPRTLVYANDDLRAELSTYEDLATPRWKGRLCLRTFQSSYSEALVAGLIADHGRERAQEIVAGWVNNLAVPVLRNDRQVLTAVANGDCEVGIVNSYYLAEKVAEDASYPVKIFFADQDGGGAHINGSGAGIAATSRQPTQAARFIELLLEERNQLALSSSHLDYPVKRDLLPTSLIKDWGSFKSNARNWSEIGRFVTEARDVANAAGYN